MDRQAELTLMAMPDHIIQKKSQENVEILTDSSSETVDTLNLDPFPLFATSNSVGQSLVPPTICPWIAVPRTVPSTSMVMPEWNTEMEAR